MRAGESEPREWKTFAEFGNLKPFHPQRKRLLS